MKVKKTYEIEENWWRIQKCMKVKKTYEDEEESEESEES